MDLELADTTHLADATARLERISDSMPSRYIVNAARSGFAGAFGGHEIWWGDASFRRENA